MGFMLGSSCSKCCTTTTDACCDVGNLPDTITVTFEGRVGEPTQGSSLLHLRFSACYGSGASATATAPGRQVGPDGGPISATTITSPGSGYAKLGRVAPTITASISGGTGGDLGAVTLGQSQDGCGIPHWYIKSVAIDENGYGYEDNAGVTFTTAEGDTVQIGASAAIRTRREQPTITLSGSGSGATFTPTVVSNGTDPVSWGITAVAVSGTSSGYQDEELLDVSGTALGFDSEATLFVVTGRTEPDVSVSVESETGSGASLDATLSVQFDYGDYYGRDSWYVSDITIASAGSGYQVGDPIYASSGDPQSYYGYFYATVASVDEDGAITSVSIDSGGGWYRNSGEVLLVDVISGGAYYKGGIIDAVVVSNGGKYYREDAEEPPYVADVSVELYQGYPSNGSGAAFTVNVNSDTGSEDFGKISSVTVDDGGDNYLGWDYIYGCSDCEWGEYGSEEPWNHTVVCWRDTRPGNNNCVYYGPRCWGPSGSGAGGEPLVWLELSSKIRTLRPRSPVYLYPVAPFGVPGEDGGPIDYPIYDAGTDGSNWDGRWAYCGRSILVPDRVWQPEWRGNQASVTATMSGQLLADEYLPYWSVVSVEVTDGGSGYTNGETVYIFSSAAGDDFSSLNDYQNLWYDPPPPERRAAVGIATVNEQGAITAIAITDGGVFYFEDPSQPAIAPEVTVTVRQSLPSLGSGAVVTAAINTVIGSGFGNLTLTIEDGGDGYLQGSSGGVGVSVSYQGSDDPPAVTSARGISDYPYAGGYCGVTYTAAEPIVDCSQFSFVATNGDATATVEPGGEITPVFRGRNKCCGECDTCCPDNPEQIVFTFTREASDGPAIVADDHKPVGLVASDDGSPVIYGVGKFSGDQGQIECEGDEQEIIIDIQDLLDEKDCGDKVYTFVKVATSEAMEFSPPEPGAPGPPSNRTFSERSWVELNVHVIGFFQNAVGCSGQFRGDMRISIRTNWNNATVQYAGPGSPWGGGGLIPGFSGSAFVDRTKAYTLKRVLNEEDGRILNRSECSKFPGSWDLVETGKPENRPEPCETNQAENIFCFPPCEIPAGDFTFQDGVPRLCGPHATPGTIVQSAPEAGENFALEVAVRSPFVPTYFEHYYPRRICNDYEVEVEIQ
jgi:hypothetical protein